MAKTPEAMTIDDMIAMTDEERAKFDKEASAVVLRIMADRAELLALVKRINYAFYVEGSSKALKPVMAETKDLIRKCEAA